MCGTIEAPMLLLLKVMNYFYFQTRMITQTTLALYENKPTDFYSSELDWFYVGMVVAGGSYVSYIFSKFVECNHQRAFLKLSMTEALS